MHFSLSHSLMHVHTNINTRSLSVYEVWLLAVWSHPQLQPEERHGRYGYTFCTASLVSQEPEISSLLYSAGNKQKVLLPNRSWQKQVNKEYIISINILEPALRFITIGDDIERRSQSHKIQVDKKARHTSLHVANSKTRHVRSKKMCGTLFFKNSTS